MKIVFTIPQALYRFDGGSFDCLAASASFPKLPEEEAIFADLGDLPRNSTIDRFMAVCPNRGNWVAIVRVSLAQQKLHLMLVHQSLYWYLPDPFLFIDRFAVDWSAAELPDWQWPETDGPKQRLVENLQSILKEGNGPLLLGATQALVDTEQILLLAEEPNESFLRSVWQLLPNSTQRVTRVASYCFAERPNFNLAFVRQLPENLERYMDEERVLDYPESRYERNLQVAIEMGDQRDLNHLLARRSTSETIRLMLFILLGLMATTVISKLVLSLVEMQR